MRLKPFQKPAIAEIHKLFKTSPSVCLAYYTGAGKTNIFIEYCRYFLKKNPKAKIGISAYLTSEIRDQIYQRLEEFGLYEQSNLVWGQIDTSARIFVFLPQSIYNNNYPVKFDLFIADEAHAAIGDYKKMYNKIKSKFFHNDTKILLVTATPWDLLAQRSFKNTPVLKRPLDQGISDGLITDFDFMTEEAQITFNPDDFSRVGNLKVSAIYSRLAVLKSACIAKLEHVIKTHNHKIGKKCIVICPVGSNGIIARDLAEKFGGLTLLQNRTLTQEIGNKENLYKFKKDPNQRFLFVVNKATVGFDMPELSSIIDLTMTRNIKTIAQRIGRVARKNKFDKKTYFYVYDKSLGEDKMQALILTTVDFCLGNYDGLTSKEAKYLKFDRIHHNFDEVISISKIINHLRRPGQIIHKDTIQLANREQATKWTLPAAIIESKNYISRTDMWKYKPGLYKWFRLNAKDEMDRIFPLKYLRWTDERALAEATKFKGQLRQTFIEKCAGAYTYLRVNKKLHLLDDILPLSMEPWSHERVVKVLKGIKKWNDFRKDGARAWAYRNGGIKKYREIWLQMNKQTGGNYANR